MIMKLKKIAAALCAAIVGSLMLSSCTDTEEGSSAPKAENSSSKVQEAEESSAPESSESSSVEGSSQAESSFDSSSQSGANEEKASDITPAMWTITSDSGVKITMLGSMHALKDSDYPLPSQITDAFNSSDILAVECDTEKSNSIAFQSALLKEMVFDDGGKLSDHISEEGLAALDAYLKTYGMGAEMMETYKPWAVSNTVDSLPIMYSELKTDKGIDFYLLDQAKNAGKEVYEVESVDFQMDLLMNFSDEIYDLMFRSLEEETKDTQIEALMELHDAWASGDIDEIDRLSNEVEGDISEDDLKLVQEYSKLMILDRNITMENAVKELLEGDKDVFFVVGAAHYVGEGGIIDLLEKDGYTVERLEY